MRLKFENFGHAERYLKVCKRVLVEHISGPDGARLGRERIRNAFCQGFGFSHYPEMQYILKALKIPEATNSEEELSLAFRKGFTRALEVAAEQGFTIAHSPEILAAIAVNRVLEWSPA